MLLTHAIAAALSCAFAWGAMSSAQAAGGVPTSSSGGRVQYGRAVRYSDGVMARVLRVRMRQGLIQSVPEGIDGYASTPYCSNIGRVVEASLNGGVYEAYLVIDCSRPGADQRRHLATGLVLEVDAQSARRNGFYSDGHARAIVRWEK